MKQKLILLTISTLILTGCKTTRHSDNVEYALDDSHTIEQQLLGSAKAVESSLRQLAQTQYTPPPPALETGPLVTATGNMGQTLSIDWSGPIEPFLNKIAALGDYKIKRFGPPPAIPILVSVHASNERMADIIKDASLQLGHRANVIVYPTDKIIELRYQTL